MGKFVTQLKLTDTESLGKVFQDETKWQLTPVLMPGKSHGQRSVVGYSPWGRKESDTTERLHFTSNNNNVLCRAVLP